MTLLFDQNLSPRLVERLSALYSGSVHVMDVGLDRASDRTVWEYSRQHDLTIVTKDADFGEISLIEGFPPKVIWIRRGNCSTDEIEAVLRRNREAIERLADDPEEGVLTLY